MRNSRKIIALTVMAVAPITATAAEQSASASGTDIVIGVESGKLQGVSSNGVLIFKGIPYAEPPVGQRRWRPPVPVGPWTGIRPAVEFGADCEQTRRAWDIGRPDARMSEDCLTLNIWAPGGAPRGGWPVMLWIHGGSYTAGSSAQPVYDGTKLAGRGVVLVSINYRLGRFGFFAHPALTREAAGVPVGNFGIMDQIAALRWVKRNIAAFGGNPNNITIFGESAGGGSVNRLMISKAARGLFRRAIAQSGGGRERSKSLAEAEAIGKAFATDVGVQADDAAALRALPIDVVRGGAQLELETSRFSGPIIDGQIIEEDVDAAFAAGRQAPVPYIAGSNSDEIAIIAAPLRPVVTAGFITQLGDRAETIRQAYGSLEAFQANVMSDATFSEPARYLSCVAADNDSYLYRFDYVSEGERSQFKGAPHAYEIPFVFGTLDTLKVGATKEDRAMSDVMMEYWTGFAKAGSPSGLNLMGWPKVGKGQQEMLLFSSGGLKTASAESSALDALADYAAEANYGHFGARPQPFECRE